MEGVGTSTAGFIGLAERGPAKGVPELVTSFADFRRKFGGYLSENGFGQYRYLAYAVEHFFVNGGTRAFIARVAPADAKCAVGYVPSEEDQVLQITAKNPGAWGDNVRVVISPASKAKTQILEEVDTNNGKKYLVKNAAGFHPGDVVLFTDGEAQVYNRIAKVQDNLLQFAAEFEGDVVDKNLLPQQTLSTCEFSLEVKYEDAEEYYENLSFNPNEPNFVGKKLEKSDLVSVQYTGAPTEEPIPPFAQLAGTEQPVVSISLANGSDGSVASLSPADFIGTDNGAGQRTGIQAFLDRESSCCISPFTPEMA